MNDQLKMESGTSGGPIECIGMNFPSEDARRDHFINLLAEKLKDPAFRAQEGLTNGQMRRSSRCRIRLTTPLVLTLGLRSS
jgi:hypothetical protein